MLSLHVAVKLISTSDVCTSSLWLYQSNMYQGRFMEGKEIAMDSRDWSTTIQERVNEPP